MEISKAANHILLAVEKGYFIDKTGKIFKDNKEVAGYISNGYRTFSFRGKDGKNKRVLVHRLQGYQKFGELIFKKGVECRHANCISHDNSWDNILIGTSRQNKLDVPKEVRIERARHAGSFNRVFTDEQVKNIFEDRQAGMTYKQLIEKYNSSKGTLSYLFNKAMYKPVT